MNAIVRITADELVAEGAQWTILGLTRKWEICEKIAQRLVQRLGGVLVKDIAEIFEKTDKVFVVAETEFTASIKHASRQNVLFCYALAQARKTRNSFILVVPYDARIDKRALLSCDEYNSLKEFEEALRRVSSTNQNIKTRLEYVQPLGE